MGVYSPSSLQSCNTKKKIRKPQPRLTRVNTQCKCRATAVATSMPLHEPVPSGGARASSTGTTYIQPHFVAVPEYIPMLEYRYYANAGPCQLPLPLPGSYAFEPHIPTYIYIYIYISKQSISQPCHDPQGTVSSGHSLSRTINACFSFPLIRALPGALPRLASRPISK